MLEVIAKNEFLCDNRGAIQPHKLNDPALLVTAGIVSSVKGGHHFMNDTLSTGSDSTHQSSEPQQNNLRFPYGKRAKQVTGSRSHVNPETVARLIAHFGGVQVFDVTAPTAFDVNVDAGDEGEVGE
jgi:hypothetical protein